MKRPGFFRGALAAAVLALVGAIGYAGLSSLIGATLAIRIVTVALAGAYVLYLLYGARDRTGRIAVLMVWSAVTSGIWLFTSDLTLMLICQTVLISLIRALHHHASVMAGLLDLGLSAFALSAAVWASSQSGSLMLTVWSFFLVQALFVGIPSQFGKAADAEHGRDDEFGRAFRTAETAIRRIATER